MSSLADIDFSSIPDSNTIPDGDYLACITASEKKTGKDSGEEYLALTIQVIDGPRKGFLGRDNLSLWSSKDDARNIAKQKLKQIVIACGKQSVQSSQELHQIPMLVTFKTKGSYSNPTKYKAKQLGPVASPAVNPFG
jgi:hypothetical protein